MNFTDTTADDFWAVSVYEEGWVPVLSLLYRFGGRTYEFQVLFDPDERAFHWARGSTSGCAVNLRYEAFQVGTRSECVNAVRRVAGSAWARKVAQFRAPKTVGAEWVCVSELYDDFPSWVDPRASLTLASKVVKAGEWSDRYVDVNVRVNGYRTLRAVVRNRNHTPLLRKGCKPRR